MGYVRQNKIKKNVVIWNLIAITIQLNKSQHSVASKIINGNPLKRNRFWRSAAIKYLTKNGLIPKGIHANMHATLEDNAADLSTVQK